MRRALLSALLLAITSTPLWAQATPTGGPAPANSTAVATLSTACADPCAVGNETATNSVKLNTAGLAGFGIVLQSGSLQGTLKFEESIDGVNFGVMTVVGGGSTLFDRNTTITNPGSGNYLTPLSLIVSGPAGGDLFIRVRIATITSGTPDLRVFISGSSNLDIYNINLPGQGWEGTQTPTRFNIIGGVDESTACNSSPCNRKLIMTNATPTTTDYGAVVRDVQFAANTSVITAAAPVTGLQVFARDTSTGCSGGPCARGFNVSNASPANTEYGLVNRSIPTPTTLVQSTKSGANAAVTATLPAVAGQFHYITAIRITTVCTTAIVGTAILDVTSTNLPGSADWMFGNACAVGATNIQVNDNYAGGPVKSSVANTNTTIVCPAIGAAGTCQINVWYYTGS